MDRYDEVNAFVQCEINSKLRTVVLYVMSYSIYTLDTHISIGGVVIEVFENAVGPLINTSLQLADRKCLCTF